MKLLHTGDLHLGKILHEASLIEEQRDMLKQLRAELAADDYAALLIAGDIYDRTIPNPEAVDLFSSFLASVHADFPDLLVCLIPGNHDSGARLAFADKILKTSNIHIIGDPEQSFSPIISTKNGERLALFLLPFLASGTLRLSGPAKTASGATDKSHSPIGKKQAEPELFTADGRAPASEIVPVSEISPAAASRPPHRPLPAIELAHEGISSGDDSTPGSVLSSQADLAAEAARRFELLLPADMPAVLMAHLFAINGQESSSERIFVGTAERVNPSLFARFSYVALGHLHRAQTISDRIRYAGSPLAYAFDEADTPKVFLKVDIDCLKAPYPATVTEIPVRPLRPLARLSGAFNDFYQTSKFENYSGCYLEITLTDQELIANPVQLLRSKFPYLLSLRQGTASQSGKASIRPESPEAGGERNPAADFRRFEEMLYGTSDPEKEKLFAELLKECADAT